MTAKLFLSPRIRKSPYFEATRRLRADMEARRDRGIVRPQSAGRGLMFRTFRAGAVPHMLAAIILFSFAARAEHSEIVVGSELDFPPYALVTEDGQADGFSVDLMKAVCEVMGIKVTFRVGPWNEVRTALERGEIDALPLVSYSEEREKVFDFTVPHTVTKGVFFKRKGRPGINSIGDLSGKAIVVMRSDATHDWLLKNSISEHLVLTTTVPEALRLLAAGQYDYALAPRLVALLIIDDLGLTNLEVTGPLMEDIHGRGFGFAVKEGNSDLLSHLNQGLSIIKATGRYDEIYDKWFGVIDPKGIPTAVIVRNVTWGAGGIAVLIGLTLVWIVLLRRTVALQTAELRSARDILETQVEERTRDIKETNESLKREITERKRAEEAVFAAKEQAELASRAKSEFLAAMSHELRTPLNAVLGFSELIKDETFGPVGSVQYRDYANDIHESGQHLLNLINDILDLSKIESETDELHEDTIEMPEIVRSAMMLVGHRAEQGGVKLELELADRLPALRADHRKLKQILVNLLSNAIKFTGAGGEVALRAWCRMGSGHVFQIIDTGIGIAPGDIPKALSRFGQVDADLNRQYEGTGLGLPLTKALVEQHGGVLDLQSQVGVGTTVTVRFPAERIVASPDNADSLDVEHRAAS